LVSNAIVSLNTDISDINPLTFSNIEYTVFNLVMQTILESVKSIQNKASIKYTKSVRTLIGKKWYMRDYPIIHANTN